MLALKGLALLRTDIMVPRGAKGLMGVFNVP
jgi:hypothetical protein